jgi:hypothetical protein
MSFVYDTDHENLFRVEEKNTQETLDRNKYRNFLLYQWGCFVTAHARFRLYEAQKIVGDDGVYCDTDSVKYIGEHDFTEYNEVRKNASINSKSFATDRKGITHYMGVYEQEQTYSRFITFGAKKYAYEYADGKTHVTISGVSKRQGGEELHEKGGLEALKEGFIFSKGGGVELVYNDHVDRKTINIRGHLVEIGPNVCIEPSTYTLSTTSDYKQILANPYLVEKIIHKLGLADL